MPSPVNGSTVWGLLPALTPAQVEAPSGSVQSTGRISADLLTVDQQE